MIRCIKSASSSAHRVVYGVNADGAYEVQLYNNKYSMYEPVNIKVYPTRKMAKAVYNSMVYWYIF
jgi:hypothetical protein